MRERRFAWAEAWKIATGIWQLLSDSCELGTIAGSLRRHRSDVGDIEIVYVPKITMQDDPCDLFARVEVNEADHTLAGLLASGVISKRKTVNGSEVWGAKNKLAVHVESGLPVDFFSATHENWFNYLVCRTGPASSNERIASAAIRIGARWNPYGPGFTDTNGVHRMGSEQAVFAFVGLPYADPEART